MSELLPAYLALGTDRAKVRAVVDRLRGHFPDDAVSVHVASTGSAGDIVADLSTPGLLADRRLVVVTGAHDWPAADANQLVEYLASPAPDAVVLLVADKLRGNSKLRKAFDGAAVIDCTGPESPGEVLQWAIRQFAASGASGDREAVRRLVELCGHDSLDRLRSDIERIATWAGDEPVTVEVVEELATRHSEEKVWAIGDAWARGDRRALLALVEQLLGQREAPVRLAGSLARHVRLVADAHELLERGSDERSTQQALVQAGANQWAVRSAVQQARRLDAGTITASLARVARLDAELKGASTLVGRIGADPKAGARLALERALDDMA